MLSGFSLGTGPVEPICLNCENEGFAVSFLKRQDNPGQHIEKSKDTP
jgi:hypothetical protein